VTATYAGNSSYLTSTGTLNQSINSAATATSLAASNNASTLNQAVTFTATVTVTGPGSGTPTGSVEFEDNATPITGCGGTSGTALNGQSPDLATCTVTYTVGNIHSITAQYLGSTNFGGSSSATVIHSVGPQLSSFKETAVSGTHQEMFTGNTNENNGTVTIYVCNGAVTSCSSGTAIKTYTATTFAGSSPSFGWSATTNASDLTPGSTYTAQASQVDSGLQPSVNSPTAQFKAN
jgi:hypothetical protein